MSTPETQIAEKALPEPVARRGITEPQWRTMVNSLYPGADVNSILMVVDYCKARQLDPMKKPCHIVPMSVKNAKTGAYEWRDVVLAGIYEYRTTAMRTGLYLGHSKPEYGPSVEYLGVTAPEWCEMTFTRWNEKAKREIAFPVRMYFRECAGTSKDKQTKALYVNERWTKAPIQMMTKVCEAAGLREAFPDEFGGEMTAEEMEGQTFHDERVVHTVDPAKSRTESATEALKQRQERTQPTKPASQDDNKLSDPPPTKKTEASQEPVATLTKTADKPVADARVAAQIEMLQAAANAKDLEAMWDVMLAHYDKQHKEVPIELEACRHEMAEKFG